jgi:hypothetical protein
MKIRFAVFYNHADPGDDVLRFNRSIRLVLRSCPRFWPGISTRKDEQEEEINAVEDKG